MSLTSDYWNAKKKLEEEQEKTTVKTGGSTSSGGTKTTTTKTTVSTSSSNDLTSDYFSAKKKLEEQKKEDIAPVSSRLTSRLTISDIAPASKKKEEESKWFQKGAFADGYDFGDITKTILGTIADVGEDIGAGIIGMGEKAIDAFATIAPYATQAQFVQNGGYYNPELQKLNDQMVAQSKKDLAEFVAKDLYDEEKVAKKIVSGVTGGYDYERDSVMGVKADSLAQSGGQLLGTLALQAAGVPWFLTSGATAFGGEAENALNQGANYEEATLSAAISAGAEVLTEKISGGIKFGGKAIDDGLTDLIARGISNKFVRNAAKMGLDMFGEGAEEWITEDINKFGQWLTYRDEEELKELLFSEEAMDEKIDAFFGGALLGGVSNVGKAVKSKIDGVDYVTGFTNAEKTVVDKVYNDLLAEAGKDGKVTAREKTKIYDRVTRELEKGGISTDTIESLLDEEGYNAYQTEKDNFFQSDLKKSHDEAIKSEKAELDELQKKLDELTDAPNTVGNNRLYDSIVSRMTDLQENPGSAAIKAQLDQEVKRINQMHNDLRTKVHDMVKGTKLEESYNELIRSNEKYTPELEKYTNEHAKKTIENIQKSGMGDNTTHFHEYVDWLAQISADKGMSFSLTNNEALKGTEHDFSAEGLTTNGFVTEDGITLNMDSPKALNSTVGHEVTHVLEQTELYQTLQDTVFKYEIAKNGQDAFNKRLNDTIKRYNGKDADAKAELTADLVGDYLFTDYDFVHNLSTENRNVFQKIYDEIKYLCKVVTAGSKEARELEKVKKVFEDAYRANVKGKADTKHSLGYHAGDLGKAESYAQQGGGRSTGHFGTGTYFVGDEAKISGEDTYGKRPHESVEFDNYNLYKVHSDKVGYELHDNLRAIDTGFTQEFLDAAKANEMRVSKLREQAWERVDSYDTQEWDEELEMSVSNDYIGNSIRAYTEVAQENGIEVQSYDEWLEKESGEVISPEESDYDFYKSDYLQYMKETIEEVDAEKNDGYDSFNNAYFNLWLRFGKDNVNSALQKVLEHDAAMEQGGYDVQKTADSRATVFMKALGYEGIDVRGTGLDNTAYGSVIYDLKGKDLARKKEIGTAKYSLTKADETYFDAVGNSDWETAERMVDEAAKKAGYTKAVYHGTDARFTVFDTDEESTAREEHAWMADYPDGTIFLAEDYEVADGYGERVMPLYLDTTDMKVFEEPDMYAHRAMDDMYGYEVYNYPVIAVKGKDMTIYATLDNTLVKSADTVTFGDGGEIVPLSERFKHSNEDIRYSLTEYSAEEKQAHNKAVLDYFGKTYKWAETGYVLLDGSRLDLSGKHDGAPGGYRTVDHRDISDALGDDYGGDSYSGSLFQFMSEGNIRIIPECNGINLSVKPTRAQEMALSDFVSRARGEVILDIDGLDGYTEVSVEYPRGTHANKVLNDIRAWFENGTKPEVSTLSQFRSLSKRGANPKAYGDWNVYGSDFGTKNDAFAPVIPTNDASVLPGERMSAAEMFPDEPDVTQAEYDNTVAVKDALEARMYDMADKGDFTDLEKVNEEWVEAKTRLAELEAELTEQFDSLSDADAPPEMDAPYYESEPTTLTKKATADIVRDVRASLSLNNPQMADCKDIIEGYRTGKIQTREQLVDALRDKFGTYTDTEVDERLAEVKSAIRSYRINVSDAIKHGIADYAQLMRSMRGKILFAKNGLNVDEAYKDLQEEFPDYFDEDENSNPENQFRQIVDIANTPHVQNVERTKDIENIEEAADLIINGISEFKRNENLALSNRESKTAFESLMRRADKYAPMDDIAPVKPVAPVKETKVPSKTPVKPAAKQTSGKVAEVLTKASKKPKEGGVGGKVVSALVDKGRVFENLSLDTKNMEVQAKWNYALPSNTEARAQHFMENGENGVKSLKSVMKEVGKKKDLFQQYLYHVHNIDRMTLEDRFGTPNKAVFGDSVTADISRKKATQMAKQNPEFKRWAQDIYNINKQLRNKMVESGLISQETANLWEKQYPHYVPVTRVDKNGLNVNVPLDTNKTGVNNPVKRATGGNSDIEPLFNTMAQRTEQIYRAIARNSFGIELKNTLGTAIDRKPASGVDEMIDTIEMQEELLKQGGFGVSPTFTVFENGERVEFEITEDMYDALKPVNKILAYRNPVIKGISDFRRNLLTVWNPVFAWYRNPVKDIQDVAINSQHPVRTYANVPNAMFQLAFGGKMVDEYHQNGGKSNTYFDSRKNEFKAEDNLFKKTIGMPVKAIETAGEFIEEIPRLAEYIASRKQGRSVERSMLDAARVTTNFAAGGDFTKFLNAHGFTFLNASVQGAAQHVRNFREATKLDGFKGFTKTLAKYVIAGVPAMILNARLWEDDEEYEELNDYVKENYFVVAKTEDGKFIRIPKGRTTAVMSEVLEQMQNLVTGDDEVDFGTFFELFLNNIAPNNPLKNNILAPIAQAINNNAWYEGDIVPSRLQDLPAEELFDESTDSISKWLGEKTGLSPIKLNYLLDQYSGGFGDAFLPMLTPEAESGDNSLLGNILAPWKKEITTDKVLNNKNPGDFYDLRDELEKMSNSRNATDEDRLKSMYMDAVNYEMGALYGQKREIQSSDLPDSLKYKRVRELQEQINELAKNATNSYENVSIDGYYATVGDKRFDYSDYSGKWYEISGEYLEKEQDAIKRYGITPSEYWNDTDLYYEADYFFKYKQDMAEVANLVYGGKQFAPYAAEMGDITADKDEKGNSISGSKKKKIIDYVNNQTDLDYGERIVMFKMNYPDDDTYNEDIFYYLISREDISWDEMVTILKGLDFNVDADGNISW